MKERLDSTTFEQSRFLTDLRGTARLIGAGFSEPGAKQALDVFHDEFYECVVQLKTTNLPKGSLFYRFFYNGEKDFIRYRSRMTRGVSLRSTCRPCRPGWRPSANMAPPSTASHNSTSHGHSEETASQARSGDACQSLRKRRWNQKREAAAPERTPFQRRQTPRTTGPDDPPCVSA